MVIGHFITIDMEEIRKRVLGGLISVRKHPFLDLWIYNYTTRAQYRELWDEYTERCRGLIIDNCGHVLNNPFPKFFNIGEKESTMIDSLPSEMPKITEKIDGVLGILYKEDNGDREYNGSDVAICTRGSFDSEYAIWATNWIRSKGYKCSDFRDGYTYLFDIVYPDNKIIVNYGNRSELVLLAVRSNFGDEELDHVEEGKRLGLSYAKEYSFDNILDAVRYLDGCKGSEFEGFVCKYSNGLRVKMKAPDYRRLHKLLYGVSELDVWRSLKDTGSIDSIIENVPDEFMSWIRDIENELLKSRDNIMAEAIDISIGAKKLERRIDQYNYIYSRCNRPGNILGKRLVKIAIMIFDGHVERAKSSIWKLIRPDGDNIRSFRNDK